MTDCMICGAGRTTDCRCVPPYRDRYELVGRVQTRDGELRLELVRHAGWDSLDLREWSRGSDGDLHATRRGLRLTPAQASQVASLLDDGIAQCESRRRGRGGVGCGK